MNLLIDAHVFDGKYQGTRTYIQGIYLSMIKHQDINFYFAAHDINNLRSTFGEAPNIHYLKLKTKNSIKRLIIEIPRLIKNNNIDYAHFQYIVPLKKHCKEIVTIHDLLFLDFPQYFSFKYRLKNKYFFKRSAKRSEIILTVSEYSRKAIEMHFGIDAGKINITPNAVFETKKNMPLSDIKTKYSLDKYILTVSRIEPRKNQQMLLRVYDDLKLYNKNYKLVIVGIKDIKNKKFDIIYNKLPEKVKKNILIIQTSYIELKALYENASLFVFPSFAEGFGIPPLEAIVYGCPTLCSNQTAMAEFEFLEENLFSPYNIDELKKKMLNILTIDSKFQIKKQREYILRKYNWDEISEKLYQLLKTKSS